MYAAPTLWNALDLDIRLLPFATFKKIIDKIIINMLRRDSTNYSTNKQINYNQNLYVSRTRHCSTPANSDPSRDSS